MKAVRLLVLTLLLCPLHVFSAESLGACSDQTVEYSKQGSVKLADRIIVKKLSARPSSVTKEDDPEFQSYSPQRVAAFNRVRVADTTKVEQRNNTIDIFTVSGPVHAWRISTSDMMDNARLKWINDDLIFVQIWWGRIVSRDLIFQLSSGRFIYAQEANYASLAQPCE